MLIAGAAALIVGLGDVIAEHFAEEQYRDLLQVDPGRLIEAVVAAVGFVGAGAILHRSRGEHVQGLTTASSLLMAAAIGIAAGLGNYLLAFGASLLCVTVLAVFRRVEARFGTGDGKQRTIVDLERMTSPRPPLGSACGDGYSHRVIAHQPKAVTTESRCRPTRGTARCLRA